MATVKPKQLKSTEHNSKQAKKELIEITPYQLDKVKVIPFQTRTILYVVWILVFAVLIALTIICLVKYLG